MASGWGLGSIDNVGDDLPVWYDAGGVDPKPVYNAGGGPTGIHEGRSIRTVNVPDVVGGETDTVHGPQGDTVYTTQEAGDNEAAKPAGRGLLFFGIAAAVVAALASAGKSRR